MPRKLDVRWSERDRCWVSDCGAPTTDRSGRPRRRRVYFREDARGPIPNGSVPRSAGYARARAALAAYLKAREEEERPGVPSGTVAAAILRFRRELARRVKAREIKARTARDCLWCLWRWADRPESDPVGFRPVDGVGAAELEAWIAERRSEGAAAHYVRRIAGAVKQLFAWLEAEGAIGRDPMARVKRPRAPRGTGRRPDRDEWRRWRRRRWAEARSAGPRTKRRTTDRVTLLLARAIADTGARPEELCSARWEELDWDLLALVPAEHKNERHEKVRAVFFPRRWRWALRWLRAKGHPEFLFWHKYVCPRKAGIERRGSPEHGAPWTAMALAQRLRKWGMPCWPYDLRRLVASELADSGMDYTRIADLLGNSEDLVRQVYVRRTLESLRAEFDRARKRPADRADEG